MSVGEAVTVGEASAVRVPVDESELDAVDVSENGTSCLAAAAAGGGDARAAAASSRTSTPATANTWRGAGWRGAIARATRARSRAE